MMRAGWLMSSLLMTGALCACTDQVAAPAEHVVRASVNGEGRLQVYNGGVNRAVPQTHCLDDEVHRQFDFWVGTWDMNGQRSVVRNLLDGCMIEENYMPPQPPTGPGLPPGPLGVLGRSINAYDHDTGKWHQTWVSAFPTGHLRMSGNLLGGLMKLGFQFGAFSAQYQWENLNANQVLQSWTFSGRPTQSLLYTRLDGVTLVAPAVFPNCQLSEPPAPPRPGANNRRLDFLLGAWQVSGPDGDLGTSLMASDMNGCLTREDYATDKGYAAHSYLYYDVNSGGFHRTYIDSEGERAELFGRFIGDALVLQGAEPGPGGKLFLVRNTFRPVDANTVSQTWEVSDDGQTWTVDLELTMSRE